MLPPNLHRLLAYEPWHRNNTSLLLNSQPLIFLSLLTSTLPSYNFQNTRANLYHHIHCFLFVSPHHLHFIPIWLASTSQKYLTLSPAQIPSITSIQACIQGHFQLYSNLPALIFSSNFSCKNPAQGQNDP